MAMSDDEKDNNGYLNQYGLSRKHIFESIDASLKRLDLLYVDLLQIHRFDPRTPVKETMQALNDIVRSGKVRYIGASSMWAHQLLEYQYTARIHGWTEFVSMQNLYNAIYREEEREVYPACQKFGMAVVAIAWTLSKPFISAPILGLSMVGRVDEAIQAIEFKMTEEEINSIDQLYAPKPVINHK
ncbi:hypothetical protein LTR20_010404 [Exophiala xenobiotica]|nr:hypothetical protein LTS13_003796 [Exophiala xenobiotica]KAK5395365.1 hypothetical protein LTR79_007079 [Exophiala xenobiotica]KAK5407499.1 hypothetical protein LTR90_010082 [Exophiala xenobiotica]KAK5412643.1 hypothetical protein LTR06_005613 [Exophiala xenobiotica]KAK5453895.1 hypothetical protein LTR20_010404 [Exophiala xenobiotica]